MINGLHLALVGQPGLPLHKRNSSLCITITRGRPRYQRMEPSSIFWSTVVLSFPCLETHSPRNQQLSAEEVPQSPELLAALYSLHVLSC